jgi:YjbE family integral membrane protein
LHSLAQLADPAVWSVAFAAEWRQMGAPQFWVAVAEIIWINILLSGDNAVVIALACRGLPGRQRLWGMILGAGTAVLLRVVFTGVVASLMLLPYVKIAGGLALLYIAAKLVVPDNPETEKGGTAAAHLWHAVRIIAAADVIMSLDNVIAIAAAVEGNLPLMVLGLAISIPMVVAGAAMMLVLLDRFPVLVWAGAALLGWIAGQVIATDPLVTAALTEWFGTATAYRAVFAASVLGVVVVLTAGSFWRRTRQKNASEV